MSDNVRKWLRSDSFIALAILVIVTGVYLPTLSPSVVNDDGGEMQMLSYVLGVPHPTGYPLMLLLGWVFSHLPLGGDVAFRVTLLSTLSSAASIALLYLLGRQIGAGKAPAAAAALTLASAPRIWMHAQATEVYGLANMFIVLGLWLLLRWGAETRARSKAGRQTPLWLVTLAFGFGLTHHISLRLFGPAALVYVLLIEPRLPLHPRRWLPALVTSLLPLLLYAYLPWRAAYFQAQPVLQGDILGLHKPLAAGLISPHYYGGLANHIFVLDYTNQVLGGDVLGLGALDDYARMTLAQAPWPAVILAVIGAFVLLRRDGKASLLLWLGYLLSLWAGLRFLTTVGEDGDHFIPLYLIMAAWLAVGADAILRLGKRPWPRYLLLAGLWALPLYNVIVQYPHALDQRQTDLHARALAILQQDLPPGAVITGEWSDITPLRYLQRVEGVRPDVWVVHAGPEAVRLLEPRAEAEHTPFFVLRATPAGFRLLPLPLANLPPIAHPDERRFDDAVRWLGFDLAPASPGAPAHPGETLALTFYWAVDATPQRDWTTFIHLVNDAGDKVAQVDRVPVGLFHPPTTWKPGQLIADPYELSLPPELPPGRYHLIFGAYSGDQRFPWRDGQSTQDLVEVVIG